MSSRAVSTKRDEIRQKVLLGHFIKIFEDEPDRDFSPEELKQAMETGEGGQIEMNTIFKFLRHCITNGLVRFIPVDEKNRYRHVPHEMSEKFCSISEDCHRMYAIIERFGDQGIWRGDLKKKANIDERQLCSLIGELKKRQLIKEIVAVSEKKKRYLVWDVEPSSDVTGGIWFTGSQFNSQLVDETLLPAVAKFVESQPGITMRELSHKVMQSAIGNLGYNEDEAEQLVTATIASGRIVRVGATLRCPPASPVTCPMSRTPCKGCPFLAMCEPNGAMNPVDCLYLQKMIEEF